MSPLWDQIVGGLVVALVAAATGYLARRRVPDRFVLPHGRRLQQRSYSHLAGHWHQYYISRFPALTPNLAWIHSVQDLTIRGGQQVGGSIAIHEHPTLGLDFHLKGEISQGRMILTYYYCLQDDTEFASVIYPDLRSPTMVGIWTGFDAEKHLISAPVVMSKSRLSVDEINSALGKARMSLVPLLPSVRSMYSDARGSAETADPIS